MWWLLITFILWSNAVNRFTTSTDYESNHVFCRLQLQWMVYLMTYEGVVMTQLKYVILTLLVIVKLGIMHAIWLNVFMLFCNLNFISKCWWIFCTWTRRSAYKIPPVSELTVTNWRMSRGVYPGEAAGGWGLRKAVSSSRGVKEIGGES